MAAKLQHGVAPKRKVEIFSAGCGVCDQTIKMIKLLAGPWDEVIVHNTTNVEVAKRAKSLGVRTVPAVFIDGTLTGCCAGHGCDEAVLRAHGLGQPLSGRVSHRS